MYQFSMFLNSDLVHASEKSTQKHTEEVRKVESAKSCQKIVLMLGINTHSRSNKMGLQSP